MLGLIVLLAQVSVGSSNSPVIMVWVPIQEGGGLWPCW